MTQAISELSTIIAVIVTDHHFRAAKGLEERKVGIANEHRQSILWAYENNESFILAGLPTAGGQYELAFP